MTSRAASSSLARVSEAVCVLIIYIPTSWYGLIAQRFQGVKRVASDCLCRDTWHTIGKEKYSVPFSLTVVSDCVTYTFESRPVIGRGSAGMPDCGASAAPAGGLATGGFGHHLSGTMTGARGAIAGLGQAGAGNARSKDAQNVSRRVPGSLA